MNIGTDADMAPGVREALAALAWQVFTDWPRNGRGRHRKD